MSERIEAGDRVASSRPALGKGLASLFSEAVTPSAETASRLPAVSFVSVEEIRPNPYQPRREFDEAALTDLAQSIRANGVIQPLVVRRSAQGGYELIAGERRLRASRVAGLKQVPVVIRRSGDRESLEMALIENIQRQDLNCLEAAQAYEQLMREFNLTQEEISQRVGKDRATIANHLRLLRLPEPIVADLRREVLSFGHAKAILGLEEPELRLKARALILERSLSVRAAELLVAEMKEGRESPPSPSNADAGALSPIRARLAEISQQLTRAWSAKVQVVGGERRGKFVIHYGSREELERVIARLSAGQDSPVV